MDRISTTSDNSGSKEFSDAVVCLPTYNEAASVEFMIDEIQNHALDVFVCDGGSTDETVKIALAKGVLVHGRNGQGKGYGVQKALEVAQKEGFSKIVLIDCDKTYPVSAIPEMLKLSNNFEMVIGAREMSKISFWRRLANYGHIVIFKLLFGKRLNDINSGLRVLSVKAFAPFVDAKSFDIEAQLACIAVKNAYRIGEVPIEYYKRAGESKIRVIDFFAIVNTMLRERLKS